MHSLAVLIKKRVEQLSQYVRGPYGPLPHGPFVEYHEVTAALDGLETVAELERALYSICAEFENNPVKPGEPERTEVVRNLAGSALFVLQARKADYLDDRVAL